MRFKKITKQAFVELEIVELKIIFHNDINKGGCKLTRIKICASSNVNYH